MTIRRCYAALAAAGLLLPAAVSAAPAPLDRASVIVRYERGATEATRDLVRGQTGAALTGSIPSLHLERVSISTAQLDALRSSPAVVAVEPERELRVLGTKPNDPLLRLQWPLRKLDAFRAWRFEDPKATVVVGVIDTGADQSHVDLESRLVDGFDFLDVDDDPYDDHGHGTHVSGIIAANVSNRAGIAGLSRGARIMPMKACTADGACPVFETYESVVDAVRRGAAVINMSLGGAGVCSPIDQLVYDFARQQGTLVVVSAGNSGADENPTITPANCDYTLGVGAIDQKSKRATFSSYGDFVDIAAPGVDVWSTLPPLVSLQSPYIGYGPASGTSMAAPFVAAAAAALKGVHPDWSPAQIEKRLMSTSVDAGKKGRDDHYGAGILNLFAALR